MLDTVLDNPTRFLFFTGKGGVGKTSLACSVAMTLADRGANVLLVSTDPASNLSEVLGTELGNEPRPVLGVDRLSALDIDPMAAAAAYRQRVVGPYRGVLPDAVVASIEEQLSGSCTVEIAAFDQFTGLLADPGGFDHIVFDTAPTGHTLRMLALPGAWTSYMDTNKVGVTCVGPLSGLTQQRARYRQALNILADPALATLVLVTRPDSGSLLEASRASSELACTGLCNQLLVVNGVYADDPVGLVADPVAAAFAGRQEKAMSGIPSNLKALRLESVALMDSPPMGVAGLRRLLMPRVPSLAGAERRGVPLSDEAELAMATLVDDIASKGRGLVMTMGKGGVGKTTIAAAIAVSVACQDVPVTLSTTDPAAHLSQVLGDLAALPSNLTVERIDPVAATAAYTQEVLAGAGASLEASAHDVLVEDLRSPCTEEIAVFRAFAATVARAQDSVVVLDTAPSGHTLLLLDAARSFQREVTRQSAEVPPEVEALLDRLSDPEFTRILMVTLPEPTPVHEASDLQADLLRAGIQPAAWVVNQSMLATGTTDPILATLAEHEVRWIEETAKLTDQVAVVAWQLSPPIGARPLMSLLAPESTRGLVAAAG
ncbi:MAG: arsenical pump-driving ATPase [Candidatus Dormibacteria bacterium]|jgi:arsenite-transporting ATPase